MLDFNVELDWSLRKIFYSADFNKHSFNMEVYDMVWLELFYEFREDLDVALDDNNFK